VLILFLKHLLLQDQLGEKDSRRLIFQAQGWDQSWPMGPMGPRALQDQNSSRAMRLNE
jgi:hypothetical protein